MTRFKATVWLESDSIDDAKKMAEAIRKAIEKGFDWIDVEEVVVNKMVL